MRRRQTLVFGFLLVSCVAHVNFEAKAGQDDPPAEKAGKRQKNKVVDLPLAWGGAGMYGGMPKTLDNPKGRVDYRSGRDASVAHEGQAAGFIEAKVDEPKRFGSLGQRFNAAEYAGKRVRMSAYVKTENVDGWGGLWMRVDEKSPEKHSFDNMSKRPIKGTVKWRQYEVVLDVPDDAIGIAFGALMSGRGKMWVDDFTFVVVDESVATTDMDLSSRPIPDGETERRIKMYQAMSKEPRNLGFEAVRRLLGVRLGPSSTKVLNMLDESHAAKAGIKVDDVVLKVDDQEVSKLSDVIRELQKGGRDKTITVMRDDKEIVLKVSFRQ